VPIRKPTVVPIANLAFLRGRDRRWHDQIITFWEEYYHPDESDHPNEWLISMSLTIDPEPLTLCWFTTASAAHWEDQTVIGNRHPWSGYLGMICRVGKNGTRRWYKHKIEYEWRVLKQRWMTEMRWETKFVEVKSTGLRGSQMPFKNHSLRRRFSEDWGLPRFGFNITLRIRIISIRYQEI
jgi:hypothetical protein